jgi:hypothetical protein
MRLCDRSTSAGALCTAVGPSTRYQSNQVSRRTSPATGAVLLLLQAHPIKKAHEMAREKTMPTTLRMSDVTGGKLFYYV